MMTWNLLILWRMCMYRVTYESCDIWGILWPIWYLVTCLSCDLFILWRVYIVACLSCDVFILWRVHLVSYLVTFISCDVCIFSCVYLVICIVWCISCYMHIVLYAVLKVWLEYWIVARHFLFCTSVKYLVTMWHISPVSCDVYPNYFVLV